jgi:hypothetical protein
LGNFKGGDVIKGKYVGWPVTRLGNFRLEPLVQLEPRFTLANIFEPPTRVWPKACALCPDSHQVHAAPFQTQPSGPEPAAVSRTASAM